MNATLESNLFVFALAAFLGYEVVRRVSPQLHTPLMSLTNAISAISVVGAIVVTGADHDSTLVLTLAVIAVASAMTNVISGFMITDRMLKMFKKRRDKSPRRFILVASSAGGASSGGRVSGASFHGFSSFWPGNILFRSGLCGGGASYCITGCADRALVRIAGRYCGGRAVCLFPEMAEFA